MIAQRIDWRFGLFCLRVLRFPILLAALACAAFALEIRLSDAGAVLTRDNGTTAALSAEDLEDYGLREDRRKIGADERIYTRAEAFERADETTLTALVVTVRLSVSALDESTSPPRALILPDDVTTRTVQRRIKTGARIWRLKDRVWITPGGRFVGPK
jgi:hypothetical protein